MAANTTNKTVVQTTLIHGIIIAILAIIFLCSSVVLINRTAEANLRSEYLEKEFSRVELEYIELKSRVDSMSLEIHLIRRDLQSITNETSINNKNIKNLQYRVNRIDEDLIDIFD